MDGMISRLLAIFPQLSSDQASFQLSKTPGQFSQEKILQSAIDHFLQHGVPEHILDEGRAKFGTTTESNLPVEYGYSNLRAGIDLTGVGPSHNLEEGNNFDIGATKPAGNGDLYEDWSLYSLSEDFPHVRTTDLRQAFEAHDGGFTCTYKSVEQSCRELKGRGKRKAKRDASSRIDLMNTNWIPKSGLRFLKAPGPKKAKPNINCLNFEKEWFELQEQLAGKLQGYILKDRDGCSGMEAGSVNKKCPSVAETIECGCCHVEFSFEQMVQCADGHLFCFQCLWRQVEESTFGGFQACHSLPCMDTSSGCNEPIPMSEVRRALPVDLIEKYEQRQAQADIEWARPKKAPRPKKAKPNIICLNFEQERVELQDELAGKLQGYILKDRDGCSGMEAGSVNEKCPAVAETIECGCCYVEFSFEQMVQCADGHLFCFQCLRRQVEESTFGGLQACHSLPCMDTSGCNESIPMSEVRRALPADLIEKYEQRQAQADIEQARLVGMVYCPFCNFPCEVDEGVRVLECPSSECSKASCIQCKEPSHIPLRCEEVEKKSETALRRKIEEVMTKAVIRVCSSCKTELLKTDGCNKVTCRCGISMCYMCRQTIPKDYTHFCQHVREPGKPCQKCKKCSLWEKEVEDDVALNARETALKDLAGQELKLRSRNIGPPMKKQKKSAESHSSYRLRLPPIR